MELALYLVKIVIIEKEFLVAIMSPIDYSFLGKGIIGDFFC